MLTTINTNTRLPAMMYTGNEFVAIARFFGGGGRIVFTSIRDGDMEIYSMNGDGSDVRRLTTLPGPDGGPFFSQDGTKIAMLTCYDASFAAVLEEAGVDSLLVGDSLGNVLQRHESTRPVTRRDMG